MANDLGDKMMHKTYTTQYDAPIGKLKLTANEKGIVSLEFCKTVKRDRNNHLTQLKGELDLYFKGQLKHFKTPIVIDGTEFQKRCWTQLKKIPYGKTISYKEEAELLGGANYARAVAGANNKNKLPIIIPCHRVIGSNGKLVGYRGGLKIKEQLLNLEKGL